ncbi:MAG: hypothetical protein DDT27_00593 [Dehalococcoidia bacterium]|nr:hypothetical protein [Chloroflexota bacterium]
MKATLRPMMVKWGDIMLRQRPRRHRDRVSMPRIGRCVAGARDNFFAKLIANRSHM